jgi:O-antigen/teichoic acid export membrane protein
LAGRFSGHLSTAGGFAILAAGSGAAAVFMLARIGVFTRSSGDPAPFSTKELARERWQYGRWLVGAVCIESTIAPGLTLMTTVLLGLGPVGILRAMQIFAVPAGQAVAAIGALALPALSRDYNRGNMIGFRFKAGRLLAATVGGAVLFELALVILQQPLETLAYGGRFAPYAPLIPLVGAAALLEGTAATYAMVLSAMQQPRLYLASVAATAPVTLLAGYVCISLWGITGAAIAAMVTALVSVSLRRRLARPLLKRAAPLLRS